MICKVVSDTRYKHAVSYISYYLRLKRYKAQISKKVKKNLRWLLVGKLKSKEFIRLELNRKANEKRSLVHSSRCYGMPGGPVTIITDFTKVTENFSSCNKIEKL